MVYRFFILLFILNSCSKNKNFETVKILGHAGNGLNISNSMYHDNSYNSIQFALSQNGCDGVEIDVQLSKDGTAWLFHDTNMKEETNLDNCINSLNDNEISILAYNHFNDEKLLKLTDLSVTSKTIFLDIRHHNECTNDLVDLNKFLTEIHTFQNLNSNCEILLITNYPNWINTLQAENFEVCFAPNENENLNDLISNYSIKTMIFKNKEINSQEIQFLKSKNIKIAIFEIRSPKGIRSAFNKYPDYLISDDLKAAIIEKY